jgi:TRAP-type C4-dicarboxylate transport system substrate-binding protein
MNKLLAAAVFVSLFGAAPALAQEKPVNLRVSIWVPAQHPLVPATKVWGDDITKASNGSITVSIFPSEQLGKAFDHYDMARDGIADVTYVNPGYQPGRFPVIAAGQIPFVFGDAKTGTQALDAWYRAYAPTEMKDTHFCFAFIHDPGTFHARKKIVTPDDIKGLKVRPAQSTIGQMVTLLGGTNVQASAPESREMLERGVADAITFPWGSILLFGIDKVTKFHIDVPLYTTVFTYSMNKATYDGMSPAQKTVIDNHCNGEWAQKVAGPWADFEMAGREKIKAMAGHEVYKLEPAQLEQWKTVAAPLREKWAGDVKKAGVDADAAWKALQDAIKQYGAGI